MRYSRGTNYIGRTIQKIGTTNLNCRTPQSVSKADGSWNDATTWIGNVIPPANANVNINNRVTVTANTVCETLEVKQPGAITVSPGIV